MNKEEFKRQILENKPIAKLTENGDIELQINNNFQQILNNYCDETKAEVKKRAFQIAMLTALGLSASFIISKTNNEMLSDIIPSANAFLISGSIYINIALNSKREAINYKKNLKDAFQKEAEEKFKNGQYNSIEEDGTINFDNEERGKTR